MKKVIGLGVTFISVFLAAIANLYLGVPYLLAIVIIMGVPFLVVNFVKVCKNCDNNTFDHVFLGEEDKIDYVFEEKNKDFSLDREYENEIDRKKTYSRGVKKRVLRKE